MKKYLATVAAVGLIAGLGAANAQSPGSMEKKEAPGASTTSPSGSPAQPGPMQKQSPSTKSESPSKGTVGQAPSSASPKAGATTDTKSGDTKSGMSPDTKSRTTGQAPSSATPKAGATTDTKSGDTKSGMSPDTKSGTTSQTDTKSGSSTTGAASSGSINLTTQQKTEIRQTVLTSSAPRVENVNFSVSVGTVVPRTVTLVAVPDVIVRIHPQWRGYRYFVVRDEIIIVEPDTLKIVAILEV